MSGTRPPVKGTMNIVFFIRINYINKQRMHYQLLSVSKVALRDTICDEALRTGDYHNLQTWLMCKLLASNLVII